MSYCRWSTDDYQCDLYIYEDTVGGWVTHVASRRVQYLRPLPPAVNPVHEWQAWLERYNIVQRLFDQSPKPAIGLPHDGESFRDESPGACADRVAYLLGLGYQAPAAVVGELRAEERERGHHV